MNQEFHAKAPRKIFGDINKEANWRPPRIKCGEKERENRPPKQGLKIWTADFSCCLQNRDMSQMLF